MSDESWSRAFPSRSGLYRTRVRVGGHAMEEEDLVAVAFVYDGRLAFSRPMLEPSPGEREWLGPLTVRDLKVSLPPR
jgi:hypothetical protein